MKTNCKILDNPSLKFRHELKYHINRGEGILLASRLSKIFEHDEYADSHGVYRVSSLYFDTPYDRALKEKIDGVQCREKFRIRYYGDNKDSIKLEKKIKQNGLCGKRSAKLNFQETEKIIRGDIDFLQDKTEPLLVEFYSKLNGQLLKPKKVVVYDREAFIYRPGNVRITIDRNLSTSMNPIDFLKDSKNFVNMAEGIEILEVKYDEFLPDIVKMSVQEIGRNNMAYSKYAAVRRYE